MRKTIQIAVATAIASMVGMAAWAQDLVVNEVMQSNIDYLMVDNDFPDSWVELYNPTSKTINLDGYALGEHEERDRCFVFRNTGAKVAPGGHLVIYCDKEAKGLHTDFRIDSGRAALFLFNPSGKAVDSLALEKMPAANIAYGRVTDGAEDWQYELTPTAGAMNAGGGSDVLLPEPEFSVVGGVQSQPFMLTISIPEGDYPEDTKVYVTVDGTEPTMASRPGKMMQFVVSQTMVVRAKVMSASALSPRSSVQSYIFHPRELSMPVVSLVTDREYFNNSTYGILSASVNDGVPNYMRKWRRPVNVEMYDCREGGEGVQMLNQLAETAVSGVSTREQAQKSLKLYTNKRFGKKKFGGDFWADKPDVTKVKSMTLRNGGNNCFTSRINDAMVQRLFGLHLDSLLDWQAYQPVVVYINGTYKGEFGLRERSNEDYVEANYDGLEDVEFADNESYIKSELRTGTLFSELYNAYDKGATYEQMCELIDIDNFVSSLITEMYAKNTDYPTNNVSLWRPTAEGGRWRWVLKDLDRAGMAMMMYPNEFDMISYMFAPSSIYMFKDDSFKLYQRMATYPQFTDLLLDRFTTYLGDFLRPELVQKLVEEMDLEIRSEMTPTFQAYNMGSQAVEYSRNIKFLKDFVNGRPGYLYGQMARYFSLGDVLPVQVDVDGNDHVLVNGTPLTEGNFNGSYFTQRAFRLSAGASNYKWKAAVTHKNGEVEEFEFDQPDVTIPALGDFTTDETDKLMNVAFTCIMTEPDPEPEPDPTPGEETGVSAPSMLCTPLIYGIGGERRTALQSGVNIVRMPDGRMMKVVK